MTRRARGWIVVLAVLVGLVLVVLVGDGVARAVYPRVPSACPASAHHGDPSYSGFAGSLSRLVPFAPEHALLCRYNGLNARGGAPAWGLAGSARVDGAAARRLAAEVDAAPSRAPRGSISCPAADGASVTGYFWSGTRRIEVVFDTSGCQTAANGTRNSAWIARSSIAGTLEGLTGLRGAR